MKNANAPLKTILLAAMVIALAGAPGLSAEKGGQGGETVDVKRTVSIPKLPDALPCFTVKATVEVTLKDGGKKLYAKVVEIDVRTGGVKPEKKN